MSSLSNFTLDKPQSSAITGGKTAMSSLSFQDENQRWNLPNGLPTRDIWGRRIPLTQK
jgi:hypothetical protein